MNQTEENLRRIRAYNKRIRDDAEFEKDHPRAKNGQFTSGAGESKAPETPLQKLAEATSFERESEEHEKNAKKQNPYYADASYARKGEYKDKYNGVPASSKVKMTLFDKAGDIFDHRSGTPYEDFHLVNRYTGEVEGSQTKMEYHPGLTPEERKLAVEYNDQIWDAIGSHPSGTYITIHNHPNSTPPSGADFQSAFDHGYFGGVIACHNGSVYFYQVDHDLPFTQNLFDNRVANRKTKLYNSKEEKYKSKTYDELDIIAHEEILEDFAKQYGIRWWKK